jgi:hypothetical protein
MSCISSIYEKRLPSTGETTPTNAAEYYYTTHEKISADFYTDFFFDKP